MRGYSRSKSDFREILYSKYFKMEAIFIEWDSCSKCHLMKPHVKRWAEDHWHKFHVVRFDDESVKQFDVQSVPMLVIRENWEVIQILDEAGIVNLISNQK